MLQLSNTTPFAASMLAFPDTAGIDTLFIVVRATFELSASGVAIADEPLPVVLADEYWGKPGESSIKYASEAHLTKQGTDVVVVGDACAPDERPVTNVDVSLGIADRTKHAKVHGDRYWTEGFGGVRPSRAKPFVRIPVTYERAFGGKHIVDPSKETYLEEPRNPVGCGFVGKRSTKEMLGQPAPNIEDLQRPIGLLGERSKPVGFGPLGPSWEPRRRYAGTYDEVWKKTRAPFLPQDFDSRFFNVAPEEMVFRPQLVGGEPVALRGFHPCGLQRFDLPRCELRITAKVQGQVHALPHRLEMIVLEPTAERFSMSWRASLLVGKKLLQVEMVRVALQRIDGVQRTRETA